MMKLQLTKRFQTFPGNFLDKCLGVSLMATLRHLNRKGLFDVNAERDAPRSQFWPHREPADVKRKLICVTGFGHSGSGAVADLLTEYKNVDSFAYCDPNGSLGTSSGTEFDLLSSASGLFALENAFLERNEAVRDAAVKSFMRLVDYLYHYVGLSYNEDFIEATRDFLNEIILGLSERSGNSGYAYCPHLFVLGTKGAELILGKHGVGKTIWLRDMDVPEFRAIASRYVKRVLDLMSVKPCLLLDQALNDGTADIIKYEEYLGPVKNIAVFRDPRDVYATARQLGEKWIPSDPSVFVSWYRHRIIPYLNVSHPDFMLIRFENLIRDYESSVRKIEEFVGFSSMDHIRPLSCLDPSQSIKNIGLYKNFNDQSAINFIARELSDFIV